MLAHPDDGYDSPKPHSTFFQLFSFWYLCVNPPLLHIVASYENKIYSVGGMASPDKISGVAGKMSNTQVLNSSTEYLDSYLRIVDFSEPVDSSTDNIDISTGKITTSIHIPDYVPRLGDGVLWISDGVMHMLPGEDLSRWGTADEDGNFVLITPLPNWTNKVWNFDLESQEWDVQDSGMKDIAWKAAIAFDVKTQVGWFYGGQNYDIVFHDLYRLDRGNEMPIKVKTESSIFGAVADGELIYIEGVGEAGILVLLGGNGEGYDQRVRGVSMMNHIDRPFWLAFWLISTLV